MLSVSWKLFLKSSLISYMQNQDCFHILFVTLNALGVKKVLSHKETISVFSRDEILLKIHRQINKMRLLIKVFFKIPIR